MERHEDSNPQEATFHNQPDLVSDPDAPKSPEVYRSPEYRVPQALVLDFDRTLGDVEACMARLYKAAEACGIQTDDIKSARARVENDGGSFDPLTFIKSKLIGELSENPDESAYQEFCKHFIFDDGPSVLYEDAGRFLYMLQYSDVPHVVLTYGVNPEWQRLKLQAAGYPVGRNVMTHTDKGVGIADLRGPDDKFHFFVEYNGDATYTADSICLVDDKAAAFKSLPEDCTGLLIQRGELLPSQQGETPPGVEVIRSFDELMVDQAGKLVRRTSPDDAPPHQVQRRYIYVKDHLPMNGPAVYVPTGAGAVIRRDGI